MANKIPEWMLQAGGDAFEKNRREQESDNIHRAEIRLKQTHAHKVFLANTKTFGRRAQLRANQMISDFIKIAQANKWPSNGQFKEGWLIWGHYSWEYMGSQEIIPGWHLFPTGYIHRYGVSKAPNDVMIWDPNIIMKVKDLGLNPVLNRSWNDESLKSHCEKCGPGQPRWAEEGDPPDIDPHRRLLSTRLAHFAAKNGLST